MAKGFYRYKITSSSIGVKTITFKRDGVIVAAQTVEFLPFCTGSRILKFLDSNGQFRFFPFNAYWEETNKPKQIGQIENFITSVKTDQSDSRSIGFNNDKSINLVAYEVSNDQLAILQDLFTSPLVYLYSGTVNDSTADWIKVNVSSGTNVSRQRKLPNSRFEVTILLPSQYSLTLQ